jgi:hypothetical protein
MCDKTEEYQLWKKKLNFHNRLYKTGDWILSSIKTKVV